MINNLKKIKIEYPKKNYKTQKKNKYKKEKNL